MDENVGILTRSKAKNLKSSTSSHVEEGRAKTSRKKSAKETAGARPNRKSYPMDCWTKEFDEHQSCDHEASPVKQAKRSLLSSRDSNIPEEMQVVKDVLTKPSRIRPIPQPWSSGYSTDYSMDTLEILPQLPHQEILPHQINPYVKDETDSIKGASLFRVTSWRKNDSRKSEKKSPKKTKTARTIFHDHNYMSTEGLKLPDWTCDPPTPYRLSLDHVYNVPDNVKDIDQDPDSTTTNVYAKDIMDYALTTETCYAINPDFLSLSPDVTPRMRGVLMDWILQVQAHEDLSNETLHLTVSLVDCVLSKVQMTMDKLQLVGITCLLIASKFSERFAPQIKVLCYLTEDTFTVKQVIKYEIYLLFLLNFHLNRPVATFFLDRLLQVFNADIEMTCLANYILDLTITNVDLVPILPSVKAACAVYLARWLMLDSGSPWDESLAFYSGYSEEDLKETDCIKNMAIMLYKAPTAKFQGALNKYKDVEFCGISVHKRVAPAHIMDCCFLTLDI